MMKNIYIRFILVNFITTLAIPGLLYFAFKHRNYNMIEILALTVLCIICITTIYNMYTAYKLKHIKHGIAKIFGLSLFFASFGFIWLFVIFALRGFTM